ncbi:MAG: polysaccharide deacetylase family protein [Clostridia bacterium]|nr:polysaccharide deacetylase family protein [Clostridia bacterium]
MLKYKITPALALFLGIGMIFAITANAAKGQGWYCVRAKDNKQPRCDADMQYIENYDGYYIDHTHGDDCDDKVVYLTFDAGYENGNVEKILDAMKEEQVSGTFFVLGNLIEKNGDLIKRMVNEGHTVANHTYSHKNMTKVQSFEEFSAELQRLDDAYKELTGTQISKYYRPPEGTFNETTMQYAKRAGYKTIFWSFAYADWDNNKQMSTESAKEKILNNIHNGAVILLHPTSATNAAIMGDIIRELKSQGYRFGTMEELTA